MRHTIAATVVGLMLAFLAYAASEVHGPTDVQQAQTAGDVRVPSLAPLLNMIAPAVVNIAAQGKVKEQNPLYNDPFFRQFLKLPEQLERDFKATGSGIIVDARRRYVLTTNHVVENATAIAITTQDRKRMRASIVGRDPSADLALLKLEGDQPLTALPFGNSDSLHVGDFVVAIGNPFGLGQTMTLGIVSALGRSGLGLEGAQNFIQTDASINPGNSGGALIDLNGRLVGVNTAILAPSGGNIGIGFAIPVNMARKSIDGNLMVGVDSRERFNVTLPFPKGTKALPTITPADMRSPPRKRNKR